MSMGSQDSESDLEKELENYLEELDGKSHADLEEIGEDLDYNQRELEEELIEYPSEDDIGGEVSCAYDGVGLLTIADTRIFYLEE